MLHKRTAADAPVDALGAALLDLLLLAAVPPPLQLLAPPRALDLLQFVDELAHAAPQPAVAGEVPAQGPDLPDDGLHERPVAVLGRLDRMRGRARRLQPRDLVLLRGDGGPGLAPRSLLVLDGARLRVEVAARHDRHDASGHLEHALEERPHVDRVPQFLGEARAHHRVVVRRRAIGGLPDDLLGLEVVRVDDPVGGPVPEPQHEHGRPELPDGRAARPTEHVRDVDPVEPRRAGPAPARALGDAGAPDAPDELGVAAVVVAPVVGRCELVAVVVSIDVLSFRLVRPAVVRVLRRVVRADLARPLTFIRRDSERVAERPAVRGAARGGLRVRISVRRFVFVNAPRRVEREDHR
mmetsp:Transcript_24030/g.62975  ORF Transcript_24030/g.62975 Transcript_24030/m.62975 type:complete len:353 (+) Transcript_24030:1919-2977(+)